MYLFQENYLKIFNIISLILIVLLGYFTFSDANANEKLVDVNDVTLENKNTLLIKTTSPVDYNSFNLNKPYRIVYDLQNSKFENGYSLIYADSKILKTVRIAQHNANTVRIVLDTRKENVFHNAKKR